MSVPVTYAELKISTTVHGFGISTQVHERLLNSVCYLTAFAAAFAIVAKGYDGRISDIGYIGCGYFGAELWIEHDKKTNFRP